MQCQATSISGEHIGILLSALWLLAGAVSIGYKLLLIKLFNMSHPQFHRLIKPLLANKKPGRQAYEVKWNRVSIASMSFTITIT